MSTNDIVTLTLLLSAAALWLLWGRMVVRDLKKEQS